MEPDLTYRFIFAFTGLNRGLYVDVLAANYDEVVSTWMKLLLKKDIKTMNRRQKTKDFG